MDSPPCKRWSPAYRIAFSRQQINKFANDEEMAAHNSWATLPSIIVVEILSYLSLTSRLNAASTCKRWRSCLFHPSMWRSLTFKVEHGSRSKTKHLADVCGTFVRDAVVSFNSQNVGDVKETLRILQIFTENTLLEKLSLKPSSCQVAWPGREPFKTVDQYVDAIEKMLINTRRLKHLSLGCIMELTDFAEIFVNLLTTNHHSSLEVLHISSLKEDPESYGLIEMPNDWVRSFGSLSVLGLDYDHLTNDLLMGFTDDNRARLEKLIVHIHGVDPEHEKITNKTWKEVVAANPNLLVTLNLIHTPEGNDSLMDILQPELPLAHFRAFFCQDVNVTAINFMARNHYSTLKSVYIVDGLKNGEPNMYHFQADEDPFVMLAWKCANLKSFSLIGYDIGRDEVIAIARLRGTQLETFEIPQTCISDVDEGEDQVWACICQDDPDFNAEVAKNMEKDMWSPISDQNLHPSVLDPHADAETVYLSILHADQE